VAAVKIREPGHLSRAIRDVRDKTGFTSEFKFTNITRGALPAYTELIRALHHSDATIAATVVQGDTYNPFAQRSDAWRVHAEVTAQLLVGCINRRELVGVHLDALTTPIGCSFEDTVRNLVNGRLRSTSVVSAVCLDSQTTDLLQLADVVAGSIAHERRIAAGTTPKSSASAVSDWSPRGTGRFAPPPVTKSQEVVRVVAAGCRLGRLTGRWWGPSVARPRRRRGRGRGAAGGR
jgi:hypothetical protein